MSGRPTALLVQHLRTSSEFSSDPFPWQSETADRLEALEQENEKLREALSSAKAEERERLARMFESEAAIRAQAGADEYVDAARGWAEWVRAGAVRTAIPEEDRP